MEQIRVFGEWINSNGLFSDSLRSVEFGFSRVDQAFTDIRREQLYDVSTSTAADIDDSIFSVTTLENFMNSFNGLYLTDSDYYFAIDHVGAMNAFKRLSGSNLTAGDIDSNSRVTEVLDSVYLQFNFESEFRDRPLNTVFALDMKKQQIVQ